MTTGVLISVRLVTPWTRPGNRKALLATIPIAYMLALKSVLSFSDLPRGEQCLGNLVIPSRGAPTAGNRGPAVLSSCWAAGRGIRPRCGASCPFGSLDRGDCGLVVGDDPLWSPRSVSIPLGRLPLPAPPPPVADGFLDCRCPSAAASLTPGDRSGSAPLRPMCRYYAGGCHAPTHVPLRTTCPRHGSLAADAQPARGWHRCRGHRVLGLCPPARGRGPSAPRAPAVLPPHVRRFGTCTADLHALAAWVRQCQVTTGALASTGVDWIPLYDLLESVGFQVRLVAPRQVQRAPKRPTTDGHDCQWIPRLHSLGLLTAACRPEEPIRVWRSSPRHRASLIEDAGRHGQRIGTAREQRNVTLPEVVSAITGLTGMGILRAIVRGERDPQAFATLRDHRCKEHAATLARAWQGTWQPEPLCAFQQSLALYDYDHEPLRDCDRGIAEHLQGMA